VPGATARLAPARLKPVCRIVRQLGRMKNRRILRGHSAEPARPTASSGATRAKSFRTLGSAPGAPGRTGQPASRCGRRHEASGWASHCRVTTDHPAAGAAAAPRRRAPGEPWSYVFVHEDQDETSKEIVCADFHTCALTLIYARRRLHARHTILSPPQTLPEQSERQALPYHNRR
jgi:hypothetical protein